MSVIGSNPVIGDVLVGNRVRLVATFKLRADLRDPTSLRFKFRNPSNKLTTYVYGTDPEIVRDALGEFHVELMLNAPGEWRYRWEGEGIVTAANEGKLRCVASQVG